MRIRETPGGTLATLLQGLAVGRIALGAGSVAAPRSLVRAFGVRDSPEACYLTSVFGGRAIALGAAYLMAAPTERRRLQRLCLGVDMSDTIAGIGALARGEQPRRAFAAMVVLTGTYAAIGAARLLTDLRR
ncbi:hypothetical protein [Nocardioides antri]|uniref:DUF4267 domain-containing protein n=1 Tax=Nocardioides antri TaxID=2607659 RepID=A0A5B1M9V8_9ACTN|nr:hypothetical protein [Nocardioides antri]KAA1429384.1 hypothetical protein F0U47_04150 [Nocardioides antri]